MNMKDIIIIQAIKDGNINKLKERMTSNTNWNKHGYNYLKISLEFNKPQIALFLLSKGCQVERCRKTWNIYQNCKSALHIATIKGYVRIVKSIVSRGASFSYDEYKVTPLHYAIESRNYELTTFLINKYGFHRSSVDKEDTFHEEFNESLLYFCAEEQYDEIQHKGECDPLYIACKKGNITTVRSLLNEGLNTNEGNLCFKPINVAVQKQNLEIIQILLENGVDINLEDYFGRTPLNYAIETSNVAIIEKLLKFGLDIENKSNKIAFHRSLCTWENSCQEITQILLEFGFKVDKSLIFDTLYTAILKQSLTTIQNFLMHGVDINFKNKDGKTALFLFIECGSEIESFPEDYMKIFDFLLEHGADVNVMCPRYHYSRLIHYTPFNLACEKNDYEIIQRLLKKGANPNMSEERELSHLRSLLDSENYQIIELLIQRGVNIVKFEKINTDKLLFGAIRNGFIKIVQHLLDYGVSLDKKNSDKNKSVLHVAVENNVENIILLLLNYANTKDKNLLKWLNNHKDEKGKTAIYYAANEQIVQTLVKFGAGVNVTNLKGNSPLHEAIRNNKLEIVKVLLKYDANINLKNKNGLTPLHSYFRGVLSNKYVVDLAFFKNILHNDVNINAITNDGITSLQYARLIMSRQPSKLSMRNIYQIYMLHICYMHLANLNICEQNMKYLKPYLENKNNVDLINEGKFEIEILKIENADKNITLYDILKADTNQLSIYAKNMNINVVLNTDDFIKKFPLYGNLILKKFNKALRKKLLIEECCKQLYLICEIFLIIPYQCIETILNFLDTDDLRIMLSDTDSVVESIYDIQ